MDIKDIIPLIQEHKWKTTFSGSLLAEGKSFVGAKLVGDVKLEFLQTGDAEIKATVTQKDGNQYTPSIAIWTEKSNASNEEKPTLIFDAECNCPVRTNCMHSAATFHYLAKSPKERIHLAAGKGLPKPIDTLNHGGTLYPKPLPPNPELNPLNDPPSGTPTFSFQVQNLPRKQDRTQHHWLPKIGAHAFATYEGQYQVPLDHGGILEPIVRKDGTKLFRHRMEETNALTILYGLSLMPCHEKPPASLKNSLKKIELPASLLLPHLGTLWAPCKKEWPDTDIYWTRFQHEGVQALQKRGWTVQCGPDIGQPPLVFKTDTWRAEIVDEGKGWFHLTAGFQIDGEKFELQPILAALLTNNFMEATEAMPHDQDFMIFLPDGRGLALPVGRFRRILQTLAHLIEAPFFKEGYKPKKKEQDNTGFHLQAYDAALLLQADQADLASLLGEEKTTPNPEAQPLFQLDTAQIPELQQLADTLPNVVTNKLGNFTSLPTPPTPDSLQADLREYQLQGYHWMQFLAQHHLHGILADDMGLGKTLQCLTHILAEIENNRTNNLPSLVIAPTSVVENWKAEAQKFAPSLDILILQGNKRHTLFSEIDNVDVVITSYALLHRDIYTLQRYQFHLLILDEAQHIKNAKAQVSQTVRLLQAQHRLCLSGTPVENNLSELWSLIDFLIPGHLNTLENFNSTYRIPIEKRQQTDLLPALTKRIAPLILRRTKNEVAKELPPKTEIPHTIPLHTDQQDLYETVRSTMDKQVRQALAQQGNEAQILFLDALLKLRQICCHPDLLDANQQKNPQSAKFDYFCELLQTLRAEKHRILLFSQFTSMLSIIQDHLIKIGCDYLKLTGETNNRQELVNRWQSGEGEIFLISLKAGGTGLTLTGADTVIHYDPWWNPAAENQATDRAYRIGQDKPVFVHKLICQHTVEERIQQMQSKKGNIADTLLEGTLNNPSKQLTTETLNHLLAPVRETSENSETFETIEPDLIN